MLWRMFSDISLLFAQRMFCNGGSKKIDVIITISATHWKLRIEAYDVLICIFGFPVLLVIVHAFLSCGVGGVGGVLS